MNNMRLVVVLIGLNGSLVFAEKSKTQFQTILKTFFTPNELINLVNDLTKQYEENLNNSNTIENSVSVKNTKKNNTQKNPLENDKNSSNKTENIDGDEQEILFEKPVKHQQLPNATKNMEGDNAQKNSLEKPVKEEKTSNTTEIIKEDNAQKDSLEKSVKEEKTSNTTEIIKEDNAQKDSLEKSVKEEKTSNRTEIIKEDNAQKDSLEKSVKEEKTSNTTEIIKEDSAQKDSLGESEKDDEMSEKKGKAKPGGPKNFLTKNSKSDEEEVKKSLVISSLYISNEEKMFLNNLTNAKRNAVVTLYLKPSGILCGGFFITNNLLLTAAVCVVNFDPKDLYVTYITLKDKIKSVNVMSYIAHEKYNKANNAYNIAVVRLAIGVDVKEIKIYQMAYRLNLNSVDRLSGEYYKYIQYNPINIRGYYRFNNVIKSSAECQLFVRKIIPNNKFCVLTKFRPNSHMNIARAGQFDIGTPLAVSARSTNDYIFYVGMYTGDNLYKANAAQVYEMLIPLYSWIEKARTAIFKSGRKANLS